MFFVVVVFRQDLTSVHHCLCIKKGTHDNLETLREMLFD